MICLTAVTEAVGTLSCMTNLTDQRRGPWPLILSLKTNLSLAKSSEVAHALSFHPRGRKCYFLSMGSAFQVTGWFTKLPYWGMKLDHWVNIQKLHIHPFSTPQGQNWAYFHSTRNGFQDMGWFSKLAGNLVIGQRSRSCTYSPFLPQGCRNWGYFTVWPQLKGHSIFLP